MPVNLVDTALDAMLEIQKILDGIPTKTKKSVVRRLTLLYDASDDEPEETEYPTNTE